MGYNSSKKEKIKVSMDYEQGGSLNAIANKAAALDAPILVIGLGGTGCGAALKLKKMVYDRLECGVKDGEEMQRPSNIEYLIVDTDKKTADKTEQGIGFVPGEEILTYTSGNIGEQLHRSVLPSNVSNWIERDLPVTTIINGAGACRQAGRLMFMDHVREIEDKFEEKIKSVTASFENSTPIYIFILSGISGGTGSGTFVDVAYLTKAVARAVDSNRIVNQIGLLFLPDVNMEMEGVGPTDKESIKRNSFAALKELDYLMNIQKTGDCFEQQYGRFSVGRQSDGDVPPFSSCILMSSCNMNGVQAAENAYEYTLEVAAETILNFIASEPDSTVTDFSLNSFLANDHNQRQIFENSMLGDMKATSGYHYAVAGASNAMLPLNEIMSYMTYLAFSQVEEYWNKMPEEKDVMEALRSFGIDERQLMLDIRRGIPTFDKTIFDYDSVKANLADVENRYQDYYNKRVQFIESKAKEMISNMKQMFSEKSNVINEIFMDYERGPVMAQRLLYTNSDRACIYSEICDLRRRFEAASINTNEVVGLEKNKNNKFEEFTKAKPLLAGGKKKVCDSYIEAVEKYYDALFNSKMNKVLANMCKGYADIVSEVNGKIYDCVAELLDTLVVLFQKYGKIKTETRVEDNTLNWSMIDVPAFIKELQKEISKNEELFVDLAAFVKKFYIFLLENVDVWTGEEKADDVQKINYFIAKEFDKVLTKSLDYYMEFMTSAAQQKPSEYMRAICEKLLARADIKFPTRGTYSVRANPTHSFVSVPNNSTGMYEQAKNVVGAQSIVKKSGIQDRVFMANFVSAIPLSAYQQLAECHKTYESLLDSSKGLHLYETKQTNWRNLPSPYMELDWENGHRIEREVLANQKWKDIFDKAVQYKFIQFMDGADANYNCYITEPIDVCKVLSKHNITLNPEIDNEENAIACYRELKNIQANEDVQNSSKCVALYTKRMKEIETSNGFEKVFDHEYSKYIFIRMVTVREQIRKMVEARETLDEALSKLKGYAEKSKLAIPFIKLLYTGTLQMIRGQYVYQDKEGVFRSFCTLEGEQNIYSDYYLYEYYVKLAQGEGKTLINELSYVCDMKHKEMSSTDEKFEDMVRVLKTISERLKTKIEYLNVEWSSVENGEKIRKSYTELEKQVDAQLLGFGVDIVSN